MKTAKIYAIDAAGIAAVHVGFGSDALKKFEALFDEAMADAVRGSKETFMNEELQREVLCLLVSMRTEYRRISSTDGQDHGLYADVVAKAVDVLEDLDGMARGEKPWRSIR
jgi:hypothetical protein